MPSYILRSVGMLATLASLTQAQQTADPTRPRSPRVALAASILGTIVPVGLSVMFPRGAQPAVVGGIALLVGPSTGYWYARSPRWRRGLTIRGIAAAGALGAIATMDDCGWGESSDCQSAAMVVAAGGVVIAVSAVHDITKVRGAARDQVMTERRVSLRPTLERVRGGTRAGLTIQF